MQGVLWVGGLGLEVVGEEVVLGGGGVVVGVGQGVYGGVEGDLDVGLGLRGVGVDYDDVDLLEVL